MQLGGLAGRVAIVTGAGSGLGAAYARRLAADGAVVVVNDINDDAAAKASAEIGGDTAVFDVTDSRALDRAFDDVVARHGRLDIVVNNAGIAPPPNPERFRRAMANQALKLEGKIAEMRSLDVTVSMTDDEWDRMIRTHLYGVFYGSRAALRHMQPVRRGAIVNVSSILGVRPAGGAPGYSTAKAAIIALTKSIAAEVAHLGIRVNAVCPGFVDTPLLAPLDEQQRTMVTMGIGMGRLGTTGELAEMVRFLCGDESSYCTGEVMVASGGYG